MTSKTTRQAGRAGGRTKELEQSILPNHRERATMPAKRPPRADEKSQRERFIETARAIGASEDPEVFERIFRQIVPPARSSGKDVRSDDLPLKTSCLDEQKN